MLFNSIDFAIFLPIVFVLYWFVGNSGIKTSQNHRLKTSHPLSRAHQSVSGKNQIQKAGCSDLSQVLTKFLFVPMITFFDNCPLPL
jgi:hypothetical protein